MKTAIFLLRYILCSYVKVKSSSPSLPYIPLSFTSISANLPSILYIPLPYLPYLPLTFPFNLPIFFFLSQSSPFLLFSFPTYPLQSLPSAYLPFPHPSPYPFISPFPSLPLLWDLWFLSPSGVLGLKSYDRTNKQTDLMLIDDDSKGIGGDQSRDNPEGGYLS